MKWTCVREAQHQWSSSDQNGFQTCINQFCANVPIPFCSQVLIFQRIQFTVNSYFQGSLRWKFLAQKSNEYRKLMHLNHSNLNPSHEWIVVIKLKSSHLAFFNNPGFNQFSLLWVLRKRIDHGRGSFMQQLFDFWDFWIPTEISASNCGNYFRCLFNLFL